MSTISLVLNLQGECDQKCVSYKTIKSQIL